MIKLAYACLALGALATLYFLKLLAPTSAAAAVVMGAWLVLPYLLLALALAFLARKRTYIGIAIATTLGGVGFLVYVIFVRPDAQGAIAVMFTPLYQLVGAVVLLAVWDRWFS